MAILLLPQPKRSINLWCRCPLSPQKGDFPASNLLAMVNIPSAVGRAITIRVVANFAPDKIAKILKKYPANDPAPYPGIIFCGYQFQINNPK